MAHCTATLHSLVKLEQFDKSALPRLPVRISSASCRPLQNGADDFSAPLSSSAAALHDRHSHSPSTSLLPISPRSMLVQPASPRDVEEHEEEEARLHAQYRLKQRLREKTNREANQQRRRKRMKDDEAMQDEADEDEEERELRLTSLVHCAMPPSPVLRTRTLRQATSSATSELELPPVSPRTRTPELSVLFGQKHRVSHEAASENEEREAVVDAFMTDDTSVHNNAGAATPCIRVAKRLQAPTTATDRVHDQSMQSPLSYLSSPSVSSTLSTASASPVVSIASITRSVSSRFSSSFHSAVDSPVSSIFSSFPSPVPASPATLPSVLHSPAMDNGKHRNIPMFVRRTFT